MKLASATITACIVAVIASAHAAPVIRDDHGGVVSDYRSRLDVARLSGERIVIDGVCASACTLYLALPRNQICATPRGRFVFHTVTDKQFGLPDWRGNEAMMNAYPEHVRLVIGRHGGLWLKPFAIKGTALVPACR